MTNVKNLYNNLRIVFENVLHTVGEAFLNSENFQKEWQYQRKLRDCNQRACNAYVSIYHAKPQNVLSDRQIEYIVSISSTQQDVINNIIKCYPYIENEYKLQLVLAICEVYKKTEMPQITSSGIQLLK